MGPLEDGENRNKSNSTKKNLNVDLSDVPTQLIDSQFSPGGGCGADDFQYLTDTMPVDDTYLLEDAFETQLMNLAGETQVVDLAEETEVVDLAEETQVVDFAEETQMVDLAEETQMVDLAGETQPVDLAGETQVLYDLGYMKSMPVEFSNEFNAEVGVISECKETNKYDFMCEAHELSQDDVVKKDGSDSVGLKSTVDKDPPREGSSCRGFTSIRAASVRASGLAARSRRANRNSCTNNSDKYSLEKESCEQDLLMSGSKNDRQGHEHECNDNSKQFRNSNKRKVARTAVRQLFREEKDAEIDDSDTDIKQTDDDLDVPEKHASGDCLARLSYADSQEPGELSQNHALEVVDRFLDLNFMEYDESFGMTAHNSEKSKIVSGAKGSRDLAKSSILKSKDRDCGIYDWDDAREDDGGGDFFLKKKELFFPKGGPKQRCLTEPRKSTCLENVKTIGDGVNEKERKFPTNKVGDPVSLDSGLMLYKLRSKEKSFDCGEAVLQKNFVKNLDEQLDMVSGLKVAENDKDNDIPDMTNIGPDTQVAAEAMENLCFEIHLTDSNYTESKKGVCASKAARERKLRNGTAQLEQNLASEIPCHNTVGVVTRQAKRTKRISINTDIDSSLSPKDSKRIRKRCDKVVGEAEDGKLADVNVSVYHESELTGQKSKEKNVLEDKLDFYVPVAHRTRKSSAVHCSKVAAKSYNGRDAANDVISVCVHGKRTTTRDADSVTIEKVKKVGSTGFKRSNNTCVETSGTSNIDAVDTLRGRGSCQKTLANTRSSKRLKRSSEVSKSIPVNPDGDHLNQVSTCNDPAFPCSDTQSRKRISSRRTVKEGNSRNAAAQCDSDHLNVKTVLNDVVGTKASKQGHKERDDKSSLEVAERSGRQEAPPRCGTSSSACATPANCTTPLNNASPICVGDEYQKQSCRTNWSRFSLRKEMDNLVSGSPGPYGRMRELRKRKNITTIRVLFSQHLDVDIVKQQKKILARLGGAVASSMLDATHFVADEFVRTRNMLEAIASGKPVVTHLWIESCGQASCLIDEKNYILRDARKEKEFGFSLPVSLSRAWQHPLLQGQKVLVTPNTKPGKDILEKLIKAVQGSVIERLGKSVLKEKSLPDDLLILSCEEDYEDCVPFLEKGGAIYSSELLLNGIVRQKLEYERHRLFIDHVKRTRSTIWVKRKNTFIPVN